jgi:hypothetical protein
MMNEQEILEAVQKIGAMPYGHDAFAHRMEDALYKQFIEFIAKRHDELGHLARMVLSTKEFDFSRWYE